MIRYLRAWKVWTRQHAAEVLAVLAPEEALEPLQRAHLRESGPKARRAMAQALEAIESKKD